MAIATLIAWIITSLGGLTLFSIWVRGGGMRRTSRIHPPLMIGHVGIGLGGLVIWILLVLGFEFGNLAWIGFLILLVQLLVGVTMEADATHRPVPQRVGAGGASQPPAEPPEQNFPRRLILGHATLAGLTTLLSFLTAIGL